MKRTKNNPVVEDLLSVQFKNIVLKGEDVYEQMILKKYSDHIGKMEYFLLARDPVNPIEVWGIIKKDKLIFPLISEKQIQLSVEDKSFFPCKCSELFNVLEIKIV